MTNEETATVCDACLTACCWGGAFPCDQARTAGTTEVPTAELDRLGLEHPSHYREIVPVPLDFKPWLGWR